MDFNPLMNPTGKFHCSKCNKTFAQRASFRRHDREVHQAQLIHQCFMCEMKFPRKEHLNRHLIRRHPPPEPQQFFNEKTDF